MRRHAPDLSRASGFCQTGRPGDNRPVAKVLILSPFEGAPPRHGSIVRTHYLARWLAARHRVWFVCRPDAPTLPVTVLLNHPNRWLQLAYPPLLWRLWRLIRAEDIELIVVSHFWALLLGLLLAWSTGRPLVFDEHNVEFVRFRRLGSPLWPLVRLGEWLGCRSAQRVLCVSETDRAFLQAGLGVASARLQVAPNGADVASLSGQAVDRAAVRAGLGLTVGEPLVLFFGTLAHRPNRDAADLICQRLAPAIPARFVIVGSGGATYARQRTMTPPNVVIRDFMPDLTALIKSADLVIAPITVGSGTRFKIVESAACGRQVISTTLGAEGLERAAFGPALVIADDWDAFQTAIEANLVQPLTWTPTPRFWELYDWAHIFGRLDLHPILNQP